MLIKQSRFGELLLLIKGHNAKIDATKTKSSHFSGYQIDLMPGPLTLKLSRYFNTAKNCVGTESKTAFMKLKSLKCLSLSKHANRK